MKHFLKHVCVSLALALLILCCPVHANAQGRWTRTRMEQCRTVLPEVNAYLYPLDAKGDVYFDANLEKFGITANLDREELAITSFEPVKDLGTTYIMLVNVTYSSASYEYLGEIKEELKIWLDKLGGNDRMLLLAYAEDHELLLDGSESVNVAKRAVERMETKTTNADTIAAIKEGIRLAGSEDLNLPERRVLVMFDRGLFLDKSSNIQKELQATLNQASLPVYVLCNSIYENVQKDMDAFASQSGGKNFNSASTALKDAGENMRTWLTSCFVLKMRTRTNDPEPLLRDLKLSFHADEEHSIEKEISIQGNAADKVAPRIRAVTNAGTELKIEFTENVRGADKTENFTLSDAKGKSIGIISVEYDPNTCTSTLLLEKELKAGKHSLILSNITDTSVEKNRFAYDEGEEYVFSAEGKSGISPIVLGLCLAAAGIIAGVLWNEQKKKQERLAAEAAADVYVMPDMSKLRVRLCVTLPNGSRNNGELDIDQELRVGRSRDCGLAINDDSISGLHCILSYAGSKLLITDANSRNGTYVNNQKITGSCQLVSGDEIRIGKTVINISY